MDNNLFPHLAEVKVTPWERGNGIKVLGLPVYRPGDFTFAAACTEETVKKLQEAITLLNKLDDQHTQHVLLRYCLDACRLVHFLRGIEEAPIMEGVGKAMTSMRSAVAALLGSESITDLTWCQGTLPLRFGGLGVKDPEATRRAARAAAILCFLDRAKGIRFPDEVVQPRSTGRPPSQIWNHT